MQKTIEIIIRQIYNRIKKGVHKMVTKKVYGFALSEKNHEQLRKAAESEHRSMSNFIIVLLEFYLRAHRSN